jgi:hypothetical protein
MRAFIPQGRIDARTMSGARMITECSSLLLAGVLVLSALGININALLLPTGVVLAIASKDLLQNLIAGELQDSSMLYLDGGNSLVLHWQF